jgi:hypothetical protein
MDPMATIAAAVVILLIGVPVTIGIVFARQLWLVARTARRLRDRPKGDGDDEVKGAHPGTER